LHAVHFLLPMIRSEMERKRDTGLLLDQRERERARAGERERERRRAGSKAAVEGKINTASAVKAERHYARQPADQ